MGKTPAVSIVMPVYNAGPYLEEAIASIYAQTFTDWELVAVDDASTDGSGRFLESIDDPRVRVLRNERNLNQAASINRGVQSARAPYVAMQDADDLSLPSRLEREFEALEANKEIDVLSTGAYATSRELKPFLVTYGVPDHATIVRRPTIGVRIGHAAAMGRTEWWKRWPYDPRARLCQDFDLLLRSHRESTFSNITDPFYVYRFVGHTRSFGKACRGVYYKMMSLLRHGFRLGIPGQTLLALASLPPRIPVTGAMILLGINPGLLRYRRNPPTSEEAKRLAEGLAVIRAVEVPRKKEVPVPG